MKFCRFWRRCTWLAPLLLLTPLAGAQTPEWIWNSTNDAYTKQTLFFRKTFEVKKDVRDARLFVDADDKADFYLNGKKVATVTDWNSPGYANVTDVLHKGKNVLAIRGENSVARAGVLARLEMTTPTSGAHFFSFKQHAGLRWITNIVTGSDWVYSEQEQPGWTGADFSDTSWKPSLSEGKLGIKPWGTVFETRAATAAESIKVEPGFKVELLHSADPTEGSWISMVADPKGRLIVSPQSDGQLLRITVSHGKVSLIERIGQPVTSAMGLLWAGHSLFVNGHGPKGTGIYRLRAHGDRFDALVLLRNMAGEGEHGSHGLVLGPDKKIYVVSGNFTKIPDDILPSSPLKNYADDQLLPRAPDGRGFGNGLLPPGGFVLRMDMNGSNAELFAAGTRNTYDIAFNRDKELFGFDSDMEWDWGMAWYRPIRINHWVAGANYGFREGTGKFPEYYEDTLPANLDVGLGSPTGVAFDLKGRFPEKYRNAFFMLDWAYGRIFAAHMIPEGATYGANLETILRGIPLNLTALAFGRDDALYFITGGRGTESGLYRLTYVGPSSHAPRKTQEEVDADSEAKKAREVRHDLESFYGKSDIAVIPAIWPWLNDNDRWIRYAARTALEFRDPAAWQDRALAETNVYGGLTALMALARSGPPESQHDLLMALNKFPMASLNEEQKLLKLRVLELSFIRQSRPDADLTQMEISQLDPLYPSAGQNMNRELCQLLLYLQAPDAVSKTLALLDKAPTLEEQTVYVLHLRTITNGWTLAGRKQYLSWFHQDHDNAKHPAQMLQYFKDAGRDYSDGASVPTFFTNFYADALASLSPSEREELAEYIPSTNAAPVAKVVQHKFVKNWQMPDLTPDLNELKSGRSFVNGRKMFTEAQCIVCHRFGKTGGAVGPELAAVGSRLNSHDILESILLPSKVVSELYQNTIISTRDGDDIIGRILGETDQKLTVMTNPLKGTTIEVLKRNVIARRPSKVSPMPEGLVNNFTKNDILDLIAYLQSGGKKKYAAYK